MKETGSLSFLAIVILAVLTILGASASSVTRTELMIAKNEAFGKTAFYIAEGGLQREAREVGAGNYALSGVHRPQQIASQDSSDLPGGAPHTVLGGTYEFVVEYLGFFAPNKGFSATQFSRYDYAVDVQKAGVNIRARYGRIGPKVN